jgi:hypothetical protein
VSFEALEGRCVLSAVSGIANVASRSASEHSTSVPAIVKPSAQVAPISNTDVNWSGYAISTAANSVSYVAGSWVVPVVNSQSSGYSATWIGIDGYSSNTVEQIGTEQDVVGGRTAYSAWFEMYPSDAVTIPNFTVKPGDSISASVRYDPTHQNFVLTINDATESESYTTMQSVAGAARSSAEWVVEAPADDRGILPLAGFGSVTFTNAYATINGTTGAIDNWQAYAINMAFSSRGRTQMEASTSSLSDHSAASPLPTGVSNETYSGDVSSFTVTRRAAIVVNSAPAPQPGWGGLRAWNRRSI